MSLAAYSLYAVGIGTEGTIRQISAQGMDPAIQKALLSGDGSVEPTWASVIQQEPRATFTTTQIKTVLDLVWPYGYVIPTNSQPLDLWFRKRAAGSTFASGSDHVKCTINKGLLVPQVIRATQGQPATIDCEVVILWDGTNDPIVIEADQALDDLSPVVSEVYTLGPWWIDNVKYEDSIQDFTFDPGLRIETVKGGGKVWPLQASIHDHNAAMRCTLLDLSILDKTADLGVFGKAISTGVTRAFLRKLVEGATYVPDTGTGNEVHILFDIDEAQVEWENFNAAHGENAALPILCTPLKETVGSPAPALVELDTTAFINNTPLP
ncbi:MAG: hypothetical protein JSU68_01450 [Phycisphaerales bacterium]|nr:MAG: hypothetical protein JSU68_01450 [Phycisphaerales bacterium]